MEDAFHFGSFSIAPARRSLLRNGSVIPLGSRAIDILLFLLSHPGELKTNAEIVRQVWPDTFVEEANLRVHLSALRKALGDTQREPQFIANVPGRGYRFIAPIERRGRAVVSSPSLLRLRAERPPPRIFGRERVVATILDQLGRGRLVTVAGPGGIGKSTVARAVVSNLTSDSEVLWIDLSEFANGDLIPTVVASALGVLSRTDDIIRDIALALQSRALLLVMDSCEHVVVSAAEFVENLLADTANLRILATSREPLRAEGERVHRLLPLDVPPPEAAAEKALTWPAVQLFVDRADACLGGYELTDDDAPYVVEICTRLDGIALAIELAAGRLEAIGVHALSRSLTNGFKVLTRGRRTALPRHQTLRATLDWSYLLLLPQEQQALRELSVFRGRFTLEAAIAVLSNPEADELIAALVAKSLLVAETPFETPLYRLLDTTRLYASERLLESGDTRTVMTRFALYLIGLLEIAEEDLYSTSIDWPQDFVQQAPGLRAALDWAFGAAGDDLLGVRLTVAALPLFFRLSLLDECLSAVTLAINYLDPRPDLDERSRMKLYAALGWPQMRSTDAPEHGIAAWTTALAIAEKLGDVDHQLRAIWALWVDAINRAEPRSGLSLTERFAVLAADSSDPADAIVGKRMRGATLHWLGRHDEARDQLQKMLAEYEGVPRSRHSVRFQFDQRVTARIILARCLWVLGDEDSALREVEETVRYATDIRHYLSLTNVLAEAACPLALLAGRDDLATEYIRLLREHTMALSLDVWNAYADCFEAELLLRAGCYGDCARQIRRSMDVLRQAGFTLFLTIFQVVEAQALSGLGLHDEALQIIDAALQHCASSGERWCLPELHRVGGLIALEKQTSDASSLSLTHFQAALEAARQDSAVGWERRVERDMVFRRLSSAVSRAEAPNDHPACPPSSPKDDAPPAGAT
ncbi:putative transcriptional regulator (plasmid) [Sinorhizobium fredii NGR234]|uniref:Transcriptional regulator n=1 Tax=Sinorhizobium fredii (strain NBRC 101917 / NGR234) TaxID=394 RepID=C3KKU6_SINFN|nr:winged helix-turn-helix domain-containing protein [Sinorhizobium fredii]ACP23032.1 putative transcriptional regulator [Sinorhizobium fredii NGR234]